MSICTYMCTFCNYIFYLTLPVPRAIALSFFGAGIGLIWLDQVNCSGLEQGLADCAHGGIGVHNCSPFEDAGVICIPDSAICKLHLQCSL